MNNSKTPGKRTLLFQMGVALVPLVLFMLVLVSQTVYQSTINGFLTSQNDLMTERLEVAYDSIFYTKDSIQPINAWLFDYLEQNAEACSEKVTPEEQNAYEEHLNDEDWLTLGWMERMPEEVQRYCAKTALEDMQASMDFADEYVNISELLIMDINEPHRGFVFGAYGRTENGHSFGNIIEYSLDEQPALKSLVTEPSNRIEFERVNNFPMEGKISAIDDFVGDAPQFDDITMLVIHRN